MRIWIKMSLLSRTIILNRKSKEKFYDRAQRTTYKNSIHRLLLNCHANLSRSAPFLFERICKKRSALAVQGVGLLNCREKSTRLKMKFGTFVTKHYSFLFVIFNSFVYSQTYAFNLTFYTRLFLYTIYYGTNPEHKDTAALQIWKSMQFFSKRYTIGHLFIYPVSGNLLINIYFGF